MVRGPCKEDDYLSEGPWLVISAKTDGANPGFVIEDAKTHKRYVMKFDPAGAGVRATAADVIGSKLYWAFGYNVPCNFVVQLRRVGHPARQRRHQDATVRAQDPATDDDIKKVDAVHGRARL